MSKIVKITTYIAGIIQWLAGLGTLIASELVKINGVQGSITVLVAGVIVVVCGAITTATPKLIDKIKEIW